ncbi:hypothetical protein Poli38472_014362 [Pythium oligandrum]|uniref:WLGC domain-containing protein n=1 Tax=Pythium oligandrum TaxID=41045 RepID=A0A8K1C6Z2_PYTOL|nr:hypothetical protein Poli38472_014362 [Pythium oligandrum]|eukprot:TMW57759.1 hypothetical protein Poli38472_014362 [Pythium oligandrum]
MAGALPTKLQLSFDRVSSSYFEVFNQRGRHRKRWNLLLEVIEVAFQTITLTQMLNDGFCVSLIVVYVVLMVVNVVCCFYYITIAWRQRAFHEMATDASLDVVFGVVFPAIVLLHAVSSFRADLRLMWIRQQFFPAQPYERRSRIYSDPAQINIFTTSYESLRYLTPLDITVKIGFNLLACVRWRRIVLALRQEQRRRRSTRHSTNRDSKSGIVPVESAAGGGDARKKSSMRASSTVLTGGEIPVVQRVIPGYVGFLFLVYGALVVAYTALAIRTSDRICAPYVESCVLYSHRWSPSVGNATLCPCLVFIDRDISPSVKKMINLPDISENVSMLAKSGRLRTLEIVNRGMNGSLPDDLQACTTLRHLILINTDVEELPDWASWTFRKLEYLHVEGQRTGVSLGSLPSDLFANMSSLHTLTLSRHWIPELPPFAGLSNLRTMYLGYMFSLENLPSLEALVSLKTLALVRIHWLAVLPELSPIESTIQTIYIQRSSVCCGGFLSQGVCNVTDTDCYEFDQEAYDEGDLRYTCYPTPEDNSSVSLDTPLFPFISDSSQRVLDPFLANGLVCDKFRRLNVALPRSDPDRDSCNGVLYRECEFGLCYNLDLGGVTCVNSNATIAMRREEIQLGIPCDPEVEAWLGCT